MLGRIARFLTPSFFGVCLAAVAAAFAESAANAYSVLAAVAGAGFTLVFAVPLGLVASVVGRQLVATWRPDDLLSPISDARGSSPRFAAWVLYLALAAILLVVGTFQILRVLFTNTNVNQVVALAAPGLVLVLVLLLLALSRPTVDAFARGLHRLDDRARLAGLVLCRPRHVLGSVFVLVVAVAGYGWFVVVKPLVGHLELGYELHLAFYVVGLWVFPMVWGQLRPSRVKRGAAMALPTLVVVAVACALWMRAQRPYQMLELWGESQLAGLAIDTLYDVQDMREDLELKGIAPVPGEPGSSHPNIVLITIDTLRADRVPLYGGPAQMPNLKQLGERGAVFERAFSPGNVTRRSLPTMSTGVSPRRVRGRVAGWALKLDPRHVLVAERFRAGGYDTAGFFCCRSQFGRDHALGLIRGLDEVVVEYDAGPLSQEAIRWMRQRGPSDRPLFLWVHFVEPHNWFKDHKPQDGARKSSERYDLSLQIADAALGDLVAAVGEHLGEDTYVVVTSDHGESLGDHGVKNHGSSLYDSEIHVPLVVAGPSIRPGRIQQVVGLVDLAPTLMELAGFVPPSMPTMDGLSVAPELLGQREDALGKGEAYSSMVADRSVDENWDALVSGRYKLIVRDGGKTELYDRELDPGETRDRSKELTEVVEALRARLERRRRIDQVAPF